MNARLLTAAVTMILTGGCAALTSPYSGQEARPLKALSADETRGYLEGRGMGFAKPAELNGYPGPMHVLEHAGALRLTPAQEAATAALMAQHKQEVRELGREYIAAEQKLETLFSSRTASAESLAEALAASGKLQTRIRQSHLDTHLKQTALLTAEQLLAYSDLRGYHSTRSH